MSATPQAVHQVVEGGHPSPIAAELTAEFLRLFNAEGGNVSKGLVRAGWQLRRGNKADVWERSKSGISCTAIIVRATRRIGAITHVVIAPPPGDN